MLYLKIKNDQLQARKEKNTLLVNLLTTLLGEISKTKAGTTVDVKDSEVLEIIKKFIKNVNETLSLKYNEDSKKELEILQSYLPTQLTDQELSSLVLSVVEEAKNQNKVGGALTGFVMSYFKNNYENRYDSKKVKTLIDEILK